MALSIALDASRRGFRLSGGLNALTVPLVGSDLLARLNISLPCEVDLSAVDEIDEIGLETLLELKRQGLVTRFIRHSEVVLAALGEHDWPVLSRAPAFP